MPITGQYDVELNGIGYVVDFDEDVNHSLKHGRQQTFTEASDTSTKRGEHSLSDWWFEKQDDWREGEDQKWWDKDKSSDRRFKASENIDISESGEISLLQAGVESVNSASTQHDHLPLLVAGDKLYLGAGEKVFIYTEGSGWDAGTQVASSIVVSVLETDGTNLYVGLEGSNKIYKSALSTLSFSTWSDNTPTHIKDMKYSPRIGVLDVISGNTFQRYGASSGTPGIPSHIRSFSESFGAGWTLVGLESWQGTQVVFGGVHSEKSWLFIYDDGAIQMLAEMPQGFILTALEAYDTNKLLIMGYQTVENTSGGLGSIWIFDTALKFLGNIGSDTANQPYGPHCSLRYQEEVLFGWNWQAGMYRYDIVDGGLSSNIFTTEVSDEVLGIAYFRGKWFFSVKDQGVYTTDGTYPVSGYVDGSITSFGVTNQKLLKEAIIECEMGVVSVVDQTTGQGTADWELTNDGGFPGQRTQDLGQTFQAGASGALTKVILHLDKNGSTGDLTVRLKNVAAGYPSTTTHASQVIPNAEIPEDGALVITFSTPYAVTSGVDYAIVIDAPSDGLIKWAGVTSSDYPNGKACQFVAFGPWGDASTIADFNLKVYVDAATVWGAIELLISVDNGETYVSYGNIVASDSMSGIISLINTKVDTVGYRLQLTSDTDNQATTPTVRGIALKALPLLSKKGEWEFWVRADTDVELRNGARESRTAYELFANIEAAHDLQQVVTFKDGHYDKSSEVFNVIIAEFEAQDLDYDETTRGYESVIRVRLVEVS